MNGDCLFSSVILHLNQIFQTNSNTCLIEQLHSTGITPSNLDVNLIRNLMVDEWVANQQEYLPFLEHSEQFEEEAAKYRESGMYTTALGDAMLLGLSNVLHLQLIVFTSIPSWPYFTINPAGAISSKEPLCLVYNHEGSGHYCLAVKLGDDSSEYDVDIQPSNDKGNAKINTCRCGRGRNASDMGRVNCTHSTHYSS